MNISDISIDELGLRKPRTGKKRNNYKASQVVNRRKPCKLNVKQDINISKEPIKICTWNVRTMYKAGKINNAVAEIIRLRIDMMGISEMRWPGNGQCIVDNHKVYHSGDKNNKHTHGVGLIVSRRLQDHIINFTPVSESTIIL